MQEPFGQCLRRIRETRFVGEDGNDKLTVRGLARRVGIQASYLSKVERDEVGPPSEETILKIASELEEDPDVLLALAGKVSRELQDVIRRRPQLFAQVIRELDDLPEDAVLRIIREASGRK